jgi:predicted nucleic acid-binding protein
MYLLDTNILSETSPAKARRNEAVVAWLRRNEDGLYISVVTLTELSLGIERLRLRRAHAKATQLMEWASIATHLYRNRLVFVTDEIALAAGRLIAEAENEGARPAIEDALIAASAQQIGATVLTDNVRHFAPMGVRHANPFKALPPDIAPANA